VAEAHQSFPGVQFGPEHPFGVFWRADLKDGGQRRPRRAAMQRTFERADGPGLNWTFNGAAGQTVTIQGNAAGGDSEITSRRFP
jgi:hypothetical protein